jgi:phosphatidylglycerophosphatase A
MIGLQPRDVLSQFNFKDPAIWLATWFGSGLIKPAPGTWGTVFALPFGIALMMVHPYALIIATMLLIPVGIWASARFTKAVREKDSSMIVVDEVVGMWITLLPATLTPANVMVAFLLFRLFDVIKPWPISVIDKKMGGAVGVMADDMLAGIFAALCIIGLSYAGFGGEIN